eukprot:CAMPEP_0194049138 /NCGR_PEP_ID=MMETSP0009_2-20130614/29755_1 /TAXON_ID=210454 /ORGANISM="Grammatophora oceanica, Strain CCMP 410" /LENGTH=206 /DNA_ID=CAMNT_0038695215 /DNA_START=63 /DNA_END=680 /DNA_ORIENTATION=+
MKLQYFLQLSASIFVALTVQVASEETPELSIEGTLSITASGTADYSACSDQEKVGLQMAYLDAVDSMTLRDLGLVDSDEPVKPTEESLIAETERIVETNRRLLEKDRDQHQQQKEDEAATTNLRGRRLYQSYWFSRYSVSGNMMCSACSTSNSDADHYRELSASVQMPAATMTRLGEALSAHVESIPNHCMAGSTFVVSMVYDDVW